MKIRIAVVLTALFLAGVTGASAVVGQTPAAAPAQAQAADPGITPNGVIGEVVAVDQANRQLFVKTDAGSVVVVTLFENTVLQKNAPNAKDVKDAKPITLAEVAAGDRVFALGRPSDDRRTVMSRRLIVNSKADLTAKQEAERAEWRARGVVGVVTALNPQSKEITLQTRGAQGPQNVTVAASAGEVKFRRYAPDSVKFADAKPSSFDELKVGDQLRAKGHRSEDGSRLTPEEVVSGSFRTVLGTVEAADPSKNEITVKSAQGGQTMTVVISKDSMLKRFPAEFGAMMRGGPGGGAPGAGGPGGGGGGQGPRVVREVPPGGGGAAGGGPGGGGPGGGGQRRMMGGPDAMQEMLERLPAATVAELKPGQMVVFSTTGVNPERVTAIQFITGIEPLVAMMQARGMGRPGGGAIGGGGMDGGLGFGFGIGQP